MAVEIDNRATGLRRVPRGFGLVELMVVVAIVVILTMIALPSYQHFIQLNRLTTDTNNLIAAMNLARNEAASRGRPVTVCASTNGAACDGPAADNWSGGWIVFTDYDPPGQIDAEDALLRVFGPVATRNSLSSGGANVGYVRFGRTGAATFSSGSATDPRTFTVLTTPCESDLVRTVTITPLGRAASQPAACP